MFFQMQPISPNHPPICGKCLSGMIPDGIVPCAEAYDLCSYICANCGSTLRIVEARAADVVSPGERRVVQRHNLMTLGTIEFGGDRWLSCMIGNVSAAGAGLNSVDRARIPNRFALIAEGSHLRCRLVWRSKQRIGVVFN
jgi:hypothetical protein